MGRKILIVFAVILGLLWLGNTSLFTSPSKDAQTKLLSHRGVHQTYSNTGIGRDDCTAILIDPPTHGYLENTLASMQAAFDFGADIVELDIHHTPDGDFAIFHDWTLDCRTEGSGITHKTPMSELRKLDIGHGYSADGGNTFPLRGTGIGQIPSLDEVLEAFPDREFLINFKSNNVKDGEAFNAFLTTHPEWRLNIWGVYGGTRSIAPVARAQENMRHYSRSSLKTCLKAYALTGWNGSVPKPCRNTVLPIPVNYARFLWGWPDKFVARMEKAGTTIILLGPHSKGNSGTTGIDHIEQLGLVPEGFNGYIWTNKIEVIGEELKLSAR